MTLEVSGIECSATDIPRELVQRVNSTYVAAQNQLTNPDYTRLQTELAAAEQELNRAYVEYSTNTNFASGWAYGRAQRNVRQLRKALASAPPYITQDVMQQYQYEKFETLRSYRINATMELSDDARAVSQMNVSGNSEERKDGISGVLPQDHGSATNLNPAMLPIEDHARKAWEEIKNKIDTQSREFLAGHLAKIASDQKFATGDRLAATLYLRDIAGGTKYDARVSKNALQAVMFGSRQATESFLNALNLPVTEPVTNVQAAGVPHKLDLQSASTGVVAIETDAGNAGSGFFVTSGCLIVTNKHVVDGAETIIARDSARKLYVGNVLAQDAARDLALLSTNARSCTVLPLVDSQRAVIGTEVYAIGNPLGLSGTVTRGIVSGLRSGAGISFIQIDATINPGNSGGPLLDATGSVLGVTTFKVRGFEGLNFAVASNEVGNAFGRFLPRRP